MAAISGAKSPELGPQDVCLPTTPHEDGSHGYVISQTAV